MKYLSAILLSLWSVVGLCTTTPVGKWLTIDDKTNKPRAIVKIYRHGDNLEGKLLRVIKRPGDTGICKKCPGKFKNKPVQGMVFLWGLKPGDAGSWQKGQILDPKSGRIYKSKLTQDKTGQKLFVRGYLGIPLLGRTQTWHRYH